MYRWWDDETGRTTGTRYTNLRLKTIYHDLPCCGDIETHSGEDCGMHMHGRSFPSLRRLDRTNRECIPSGICSPAANMSKCVQLSRRLVAMLPAYDRRDLIDYLNAVPQNIDVKIKPDFIKTRHDI
jgi:hypothetical protein